MLEKLGDEKTVIVDTIERYTEGHLEYTKMTLKKTLKMKNLTILWRVQCISFRQKCGECT